MKISDLGPGLLAKALRLSQRDGTRKRLGYLTLWAVVLVARDLAAAESPKRYYSVEDIAGPPGVTPECNGLGFLPDGRMAAVFDHGEVCFYDPTGRHWSKFAEGLHTPLGILPLSAREVLVCQRAELTRLVDSHGDGTADLYQCVSDQWGLSGNYHEFAYGPVRDAQGNLYVALGSSSRGGVARYEVRGRFNPAGFGFGARAMFSVVPYRGWVLKIAPDGALTPVACGFRQPNGIVFDPQGRLFVTDNQGDWVGTSKLHYVLPGQFYGQPAGLVWRGDWKGQPSVLELDRMRREGNVLFSHAILANSPGQPVFDLSGGKFGPFAGQMFVTEFNIPRVLRVMLEEVGGELQGATAPFYDGPPLRAGNIRLAFAPDGSLWVGQSERRLGWPAGAGIQRIRWNGEIPLDILTLHLTATGFEFTFTKPVDPATAGRSEAYSGRRYYYLYHADYGSPRVDVHDLSVSRPLISADGRKVRIDIAGLRAGYIYEFNLKGIRAADGSALLNPLIGYTANRLQDGSARPIPWPPPTGAVRGTGHDSPPGGNPND
jgi:glucose/arabinose dehydrogenase